MEFTQVLARRRMVRRYLSRPVSEDTLERVLRAASRAPSAGFSQGQHLVVVTSQARRQALAGLAGEDRYVSRGFEPWLSQAPVHVVLCVRPQDYLTRYQAPDKAGSPLRRPEWSVPYWWVDGGCTLMLLLLAAVEEGLAAGFLGAHHLGGIRSLLGIPDEVEVVGLVTLGYGAPDRRSGSLARGRRSDVVHREGWGGVGMPGGLA